MGVSLEMNVVGYDPAISVEAAWKLPSQIQPVDSKKSYLESAITFQFIFLLFRLQKGSLIRIYSKKPVNCPCSILLGIEVVNTVDVLEFLDKGNLRNFITDFPTPELIKRANEKKDVILLPHIGASTAQAEENCAVMAVNQMTEFLETGNIKNSVNFPNVQLKRTTEHRISIINKNVLP